jgi:hypothetical protein
VLVSWYDLAFLVGELAIHEACTLRSVSMGGRIGVFLFEDLESLNCSNVGSCTMRGLQMEGSMCFFDALVSWDYDIDIFTDSSVFPPILLCRAPSASMVELSENSDDLTRGFVFFLFRAAPIFYKDSPRVGYQKL